MKKIFALICALACVQSVNANVNTESEMVSFCAMDCGALELPATWTACDSAHWAGECWIRGWCSPTLPEMSTPCVSVNGTVSPSDKAACDIERCLEISDALAAFIVCVSSHIVYRDGSDPNECCHHYYMIDCEELAACQFDMELAVGVANENWKQCMKDHATYSSKEIAELEEAINNYLACS